MAENKKKCVACAGMRISNFKQMFSDSGVDYTKIEYVCIVNCDRSSYSLVSKWFLLMHLVHDKDHVVLILGTIIDGNLESFSSPVVLI